jgi:hypothetical protein
VGGWIDLRRGGKDTESEKAQQAGTWLRGSERENREFPSVCRTGGGADKMSGPRLDRWGSEGAARRGT